MNSNPIKTGMILAAGFGKRLKPLTDNTPKPLVKLHRKCLIDYAIEYMNAVGIKKIIVNTHYLAPKIHEHLQKYKLTDTEIIISYEPDLLETGGGIINAMRNICHEPLLVMNSDIFFDLNTQAEEPILHNLMANWDPDKMDGLFMLKDIKDIKYECYGDFSLSREGKIIRFSSKKNQFIFTGAYIISPKFFSNYPIVKFPLKDILFKADEHNYHKFKFYGMELTDKWFDLGTVERLNYVERYLKNKYEHKTNNTSN